MITEQDRLDAMESIEYAGRNLAIEIAVIKSLDQHWLVHGLSRNLGYYRTFIECSCGAGWWFGEHDGDPTGQDRWAIHRAQVIRDASVTWAGQEVGGIRIKGLSHIDKPFSLVLATSKTKFAKSTFAVLPDIAEPAIAATPPRDASGRNWLTELTLAGDDLEAVASLGKAATDAHATAADIAAIRARYDGLKVGA